MRTFEIRPGKDDYFDGLRRHSVVLNHNPNQASVWDLTDQETLALYQALHAHFARQLRDQYQADATWADGIRSERAARARRTEPCPCRCNQGKHCGGCGHAGCGYR